MEKYIINGVEVEYDTFDLENMELYDSEVRRIAEASDSMKNATGENYLQFVRSVCDDIMDAFDTLIGEGASKKIFGGRVNVKVIPMAWRGFMRDVGKQMASIGEENGDVIPMNREQRRAAEREKRRAEAKAKIAQRSAEIRAEMNAE